MDENLDSNDLCELIQIDGLMEAEIIKSKLESFSIPCILKYEAMGRLLGITSDGLGKVKIMVPESYLAEAEEILNKETDL